MRLLVLIVAVCALSLSGCGNQSPLSVNEDGSESTALDSDQIGEDPTEDAKASDAGTPQASDKSSPLSKESMLQQLATLNTEFEAQLQTYQTSPSGESFLNAMQLKEQILAIQADLHGATSSEVIVSLEWLSHETLGIRDFDTAEHYQQRLLNVLTQKYGKTDYRVTNAQWALKTTLSIKAMTPEQVQQFYTARHQTQVGV